MGFRWRALYADGTWDEPDGVTDRYKSIRREDLRIFQLYADDQALEPVFSWPIPANVRLVYRERNLTFGQDRHIILVALESMDRQYVEAWFIEPVGNEVKIDKFVGSYSGEEPYTAPELWPEEHPVYAY